MNVKIEESWKKHLEEEFQRDYFKNLAKFVRGEYEESTIYPPGKEIFRAFDHAPFDKVKVVILGQDPYHGPGQANGLCFAVSEGVRLPPSLKNIYKEIESDLGIKMPEKGSLENWARQGVLLLNATLTVRERAAGSHQKKGWEEFTDAAIRSLSEERENLVFMLWGRYARDKGSIVDKNKHLVLESPHPSPFSANSGFFGCKHFSKANAYLKENGKEEIDWSKV